jgi:hypothetical protein
LRPWAGIGDPAFAALPRPDLPGRSAIYFTAAGESIRARVAAEASPGLRYGPTTESRSSSPVAISTVAILTWMTTG